VNKEHIDNLFERSEINVQTVFNKTTIVSAKLPNGFVIVESTGCVDPENYSEEIGKNICIERIKNKLWELEGYLLQDKLA
jgi:hypothetical protein